RAAGREGAAATVLPSGSIVINSCSSTAEQLCNFVCDCSNCSDENQCGYLWGSAVLGTPFTCDFEEGDCGWQDESTSAYRWVRSRASLATWGTGPHSDHTVGTNLGWFMVTVSPPTKTTATAWLRSPVMREAAATCEIRAWYHLSGSSEGAHGEHGRALGDEVVGLWQSPKREGEGWHQLVAYPGRIAEQFQVRQGSAGTWHHPHELGPEGPELVLDDIVFRNCGVQEPGQQLCGAEESRCGRGSCLAQHRFCDGTDDCGDGSDEDPTSCSEHPWPWGGGSCPLAPQPYGWAEGLPKVRPWATTFEEGDGGWRDVSVGRLRWGVQRGTELADTVLTGEAVPIDEMMLFGPQHCRSSQGAGTPWSRLAGVPECHCRTSGGDTWAGCWAGATAPISQDVLCPGAFLALQAGEGQMVAAAKARTPLLGPSGPACAMEMSYHIHSGPQGNASAPSQDALPGPRVLCLLPAQASSPGVELLGLVDLQDSASAAIDNVTFVQCALSHSFTTVTSLWPELSCNFERGMCGWYQDQSSDFKWVRGMGQGQGSDHTTGSGYFLAADPSVPWSRGQQAQIITYSQEPTTTPRCLSFWYRLAGPQIGTLNLKMQLEGVEETVLWTRRGTQGSVWHRGWATLPVAFEALRNGFLGDMALDDLVLTAGPCGAELSCSFEAGSCGLAASGQHSWLWQSNGTGTTAGPAADHTTGTTAGHYMVVSTGRGSLPAGHVAALTSQPYRPSAPTQCLAFWYQLSAGTPGSLGIFMEQSGVRRKVMGVSTMEGDMWHRGHVTVRPDGDWQVIFEAVGAGSNQGYIALDDLHVSDGPCPEPASCDFEQDMCGWSSPSDPHLQGFAWGWKSGVPLAKYPGPEQDHTLGTKNGHYMHFDTSVLGPGGTTARLESQHLPAAADSCLQFWYHMDIPEHLSCGELRVMLHGMAGQRTLWSVAGHRSWGWQSGMVPVRNPSEFQIIFEITTQKWPIEGTVALDDIVYSTGGGCHSSLEVPSPAEPLAPGVTPKEDVEPPGVLRGLVPLLGLCRASTQVLPSAAWKKFLYFRLRQPTLLVTNSPSPFFTGQGHYISSAKRGG
uniref:MAM domain containing 4 n=1 Tax=Athene cunicularia TaxID=194338 RepID=A0A663NEH0_ATHCN